ncbi:fimbrial protein [Serratia marcescens]|uniref:fimbrial protein n=1 Tax=Serratia marcescens TaxID=615 RepID=UPI000744F2B3|nr:fimbrial protein [Serratia marcescens]NRN20741.1 fimbrial protein [Serratia marcescens]NRN25487.1 fimbrial protein [Serratia marcescens]NRN56651.1 fimbrial protein [Serratia marcescens]NSM13386.1 fimbrial protein [Serratia marcescens]NSM96033.1 fimbrial protein [Serratia marcescens]
MKLRTQRTMLLAGVYLVISSTSYAADGTINFTGTVTDQTCTVEAGSANQTIPMGNVSAKAFRSVGDTALPTKFNIALVSCPDTVKKASIKFDGIYADGNTTLLSLNKETNAATGIGVALYEADGTTQIPVASFSNAQSVQKDIRNVFTYVAKYMSTSGTVTVGPANATTQFSISYN